MSRSLLSLFCVGAIFFGTAGRAQTVSISGLFTTGVDSSGVAMGDTALDAHYVVTASTAGSNYIGTSYTVQTSSLDAAWAYNSSSYRWIVDPRPGSPDGTSSRPSGTFDYTLTFTMPAGATLSTVAIAGTGAAGDSATIYVNGTLVSGQSLTGGGSTNSFSLNSTNSTFNSTTNTITFRVTNVGNNSSTGLLITGFSGTVAVPEVGAFLPIGVALALFGLIRFFPRRPELI